MNTVEKLYYDLQDGKVYNVLIGWGAADKPYEDLVEKWKLDLDRQNELFEVVSGISATSEEHGFEQGLKLGLKLAFELFGNT
ncbi:MAG: hypothetical protein ACI4WS_07660 [Oscillospiraceae bacterium]